MLKSSSNCLPPRRNSRRRIPQRTAGFHPITLGGTGAQNLFAFLLGLGALLQVRIIGYLGLTELLLCILLPYYLFTQGSKIARSRIYPFIVLSLGWLMSALVTDFWRHTALTNLLKGSAAIGLWIGCLVGLYCLFSRDIKCIRWFSLGLAVSSVVALFYFRPGYLVSYEEAYGEGAGFSFRTTYAYVLSTWLLVAAVFFYRKSPLLLIGACLSFAVVCFLFGSRSLGGIYLLASILTCVLRSWLALPMRTEDTPRLLAERLPRLLAIAAVGTVCIYFGYKEAALRNVLGDAERERFVEQSNSKVGILAGRSEFASGILAVMDSPILGYGSWAKDTQGYMGKTADVLGMEVNDSALAQQEDVYIQGHSHIWNSWVWHGALGGIFWIYVLIFIFRFLFRCILAYRDYLLFNLIVIVTFIWDILFSPFGMRPAKAAYLCFFVVIYGHVWRKTENHQRSKKRMRGRRSPACAAVAS